MDRGVAALLTLSAEVNKALELEVFEYAASSDEFNRENFVANTAALDRVFRTLKRFGLIKSYEPKQFSEEFLSLLD